MLADIFLGKITKWNDPAIAKLNPGVKLPATDITVVHRSDGSGTTYIWVDYLAKVSPEWKKKVGVNTSVNWPAGVGGKGNEGVSGLVTADAGLDRLRRADLRAAEQDQPTARCRTWPASSSSASVQSVTAAAAAAVGEHAGRLPGLDHQRARQGRLSDLVVHLAAALREPEGQGAGKVMVDFMKWALTDGQKFAARLGYAPLPAEVVKLEMAALTKIKSRHERSVGASSKRLWGSGSGPARSRSCLVLIVVGDRLRADAPVACCRSRKFGLSISGARDSGIRCRRVRRAAVHLGHAVFVGSGALIRHANRARHRDLHLGAVSGRVCASRSCSSPSCWRPFRRSSTGSGASSCWCRPSARSKRRCPAALRQLPLFSGPPLGVGMLSAALILAIMVIPVHLVGGARGAKRCRSRSVKAPTRWAPPASKRSAPRSSTRAPASSARSCSASAARSARRWP